MNTSHWGNPKNWRRAAVAAVTAAVAVIATLGTAQAAVAAEYTYPAAIDPASIAITQTSENDGVTVTDRLQISANWSIPAGAAGGETFGFTLPPEFSRHSASFPIMAADDPSQTVANCEVSADSPSVVTCTLTDYVNDRDGTSGSMWFDVGVSHTTESHTVDFVVDDKVVPVDLPGDGGITPEPPNVPTTPTKDGWISTDGRLGWQISFPGSAVAGIDAVHVADDLTAGGADAAAHHNVDGALQVWSTDAAGGGRQNITDWTGGWNADGSGFAIDLAGPLDATRTYVVKYYTVPDAPQPGAVYANQATVDGVQLSDRVTWQTSGGGEGTGPYHGRFTLAKQIAGDGGSRVPADTMFTVTYSYGSPVQTGTLEIRADGTVSTPVALANGTVVTLEEVGLPDIDGVTWQTPAFAGDGVTDLGDGRAQFTVGSGATTAIVLTNRASVSVPPEPTPTPTPPVVSPQHPPTTSPAVPATPPSTGTLAVTGAGMPRWLVATAIALVAGGAVIALHDRRLRRARRG